MATTTSTDDRTDPRDSELLSNDLANRLGYVIGVDGDGDAHVHYPARGVIEVFDVGDSYAIGDYIDGEPVETADLGSRPLWHWMDYARDECGAWTETTHREPEGFNWGEER